jgi:glycosyltransferase involved in cell wall biosynthesis
MMSVPTKHLIVEGWRSISQSYAVINQWQLLAMMRRRDLTVIVRDMPYFDSRWAGRSNLFEPSETQALAALPLAAPSEPADATLRITAPYNFTLAPHGRTAVFGTSEFRVITPMYLQNKPDIARLSQETSFLVWAPSRWSATGFLRLGLRPEQVALIPLGVEPATFRPSSSDREATRQRMGLNGFVFLSVGAMTGTKGMDLLLRAFAAVASQRPDAMLFLKGADSLYQSSRLLDGAIRQLSQRDQQLLADRFVYNGEPLSMKQMAALYNGADAYVSPYRAEGFNIPVLEAAACGVPVICTSGGATDDFVTDDFALRIQSNVVPAKIDGVVGDQLAPDFDHLVAQMLAVMDRHDWRLRASQAGPTHVATRYHWDRIVQQLVDALFKPTP